MKRATALARLRSMEQRLRRHGVSALYLFGSTARDEAGTASDIDLLFEVAPGSRLSIFDHAGLTAELSDELGRNVDLVAREALHSYLKRRVETDMMQVF